jgi:hypothetical protein
VVILSHMLLPGVSRSNKECLLLVFK